MLWKGLWKGPSGKELWAAFESWKWILADSQPGNSHLSPGATKRRTLPTAWRSLKQTLPQLSLWWDCSPVHTCRVGGDLGPEDWAKLCPDFWSAETEITNVCRMESLCICGCLSHSSSKRNLQFWWDQENKNRGWLLPSMTPGPWPHQGGELDK